MTLPKCQGWTCDQYLIVRLISSSIVLIVPHTHTHTHTHTHSLVARLNWKAEEEPGNENTHTHTHTHTHAKYNKPDFNSSVVINVGKGRHS